MEAAELPLQERISAGLQLGMNSPRYHQILNKVIDDPEALAEFPGRVNRLRRIRDSRKAARSLPRP